MGLRPTISNDVPKLLTDLIIKCWDAEIENRPTTKELYQILTKWNDEIRKYSEDGEDYEDGEYSEYSEDGEEDGEDIEDIEYSEYSEDGEEDGEDIEDIEYSEFSEDGEEDGEDSEDAKDSENVNSSDLLSSFQFSSDANYTAQSTSDPISECLDCLIK
ncbi:unnamed protein product [Rhizophagus irregularis]|uniref:Serine-threonine/tyrosine-protein kinase catalytic domain-containing protein n=1 Tax=Rhizophagus irregularis TaxID=588596 RepID=A0A916E8G3_9GLOM|nr:unnamed protein product [Rhizophagus irregularis]